MKYAYVYSVCVLCSTLSSIVSVSATQNQIPYNPTQILQQFGQNTLNGSANSALSLISNFFQKILGSNPNIFQQIGNILGQNGTNLSPKTPNNTSENVSFMDAVNGVLKSPQVQQAISTGETALDLYLQNYLGNYGVGTSCYKDLKRTASGLVSQEDWAIRMIDAYGKPGSDLKNYQLKWIGAYEECLAVEPRSYKLTAHGLEASDKFFSGKYCAVDFELEKGQLPFQPSITEGSCWPDTCSSTDLAGLLRAVVVLVSQNDTAKGPNVKCQEKKSLDTKAIVAICILSVLGILMVLGTLYDVIAIQMQKPSNKGSNEKQKSPPSNMHGVSNGGFSAEPGMSKTAQATEANLEKIDLEMKAVEAVELSPQNIQQTAVQPQGRLVGEPIQGVAEKILLAFSVYTNGVKIISTHQAAGSLGAVNGIRFLSMAWIILGHSYFFAFGYTENLLRFFFEQQYEWHTMGILYATVSVDSFFALSGLLVAYLTLKELKKAGGVRNFNWFMFFFHRFWRLTPPYMLVLMVFTCLVKYMGSGPLWPTDTLPYDGCDKSWWTNLLYVNNFVKTKESCIGWTWYLANDMQFYILSPLILIPLFYQIIIGGIVSLLFLVATVVTTALIVMNHHYPVQQGEGVPPADDQDYSDNVYIPCYTRMGPYIIGLVTGYLLYRTKCKVYMPKVVALFGWLVCLFICASVVYGPYSDDKQSHIFTAEQSIAYFSLHRTGWGIAICWIVFACATGYGGWINELLSWKAFVPLGRLTYCAYLLHPIVELFYYMSRRRLLYFNTYEVIYMFLPNLVMSYGIAFLVSLAFESPMMGIEKALFKRDRRS